MFLNDAYISWNPGAGTPSASQAQLQTTAVSTKGLFNLANGGVEPYNVLELALSTGAQGAVESLPVFTWIECCSSAPIQPLRAGRYEIPSTGNLGFMCTGSDLFGTSSLSAVDSDAVTWTNRGTVAGPIFLERANQAANPGRSVAISFTGQTAQNMMMRYYDISGAATAPFDLTAFLGATGTSNVNSISNAPTIVPSTANGLVIGLLFNGLGPTLGCTGAADGSHLR